MDTFSSLYQLKCGSQLEVKRQKCSSYNHWALDVLEAGRYWQVADGPSSSLTIDTDDVPLGSYTMDIVIYHYRGREKFIPMGYASTQFSITGELRVI